jgi:hypothetical protein
MLRSAADAASAAIDYSKGNIEDGVVDSPPSRGPSRTPICSPSPLKRVSSGRAGSFSPAQRTDVGTSRRLDLPVQEITGYPRLEDTPPSPSPLTQVGVPAQSFPSTSEAKTRSSSLDRKSYPRLVDKPAQALLYAGPRRASSADTLFRQRIFREQRRSLDSKSIGVPKPCVDDVQALLPRPPPRGTKSLSTCEVSLNARKPKRKESGSHSRGLCSAADGDSRLHHHSRREDILRGLAKLKGMQATKTNCTVNADA